VVSLANASGFYFSMDNGPSVTSKSAWWVSFFALSAVDGLPMILPLSRAAIQVQGEDDERCRWTGPVSRPQQTLMACSNWVSWR